MSALLSRAADRSADRPAERGGSGLRAPFAGAMRSRPGWQAAAVAAVWSAATVLLPLQLLVLVGWVASDTNASPFDAIALGSYGWLLGHGVPLTLPGEPATTAVSGLISLRPLGVLLFVAVLLYRAGSWAARVSRPRSGRAVGILTAEVALVYGALAAGVAAVTQDGPARPSVVLSALAGVVVAGLAAGLGALRGAGLLSAVRSRVPVDLRAALDAGAGAILVLVAGAGLVLALALVAHFSRVVGLAGALSPGFTGWLVLLVLNLVLLPNAAVYALSFVAGPGFALGVGTSVSLGGTSVGPMPALSLIGAVPEGSAAPPYAYAVLLVPLAAGVTAGLLAVARAPRAQAERAALRGAAAGVVAGVGTGLLAWAAGGAVGSGQLASIGPSPLLVGLVVTVEVGVLAAVTAWLACPRAAAQGAAADTASSVASATTSIATSSDSAAPTTVPRSEGATPTASATATPVASSSGATGLAEASPTAPDAATAADAAIAADAATAASPGAASAELPTTRSVPLAEPASLSTAPFTAEAALRPDEPPSDGVAARVRRRLSWSRRRSSSDAAAAGADEPSETGAARGTATKPAPAARPKPAGVAHRGSSPVAGSPKPAPAAALPSELEPSPTASDDGVPRSRADALPEETVFLRRVDDDPRRGPSTPTVGSLKPALPAPSPAQEPAVSASDDDGPRSRPDALPEETVVLRRVVND